MTMNVAIVHYHLIPGGVQRVIRNAARALRDADIRIAIIVGDEADADLGPDVTTRTVPGLAYDAEGRSADPRELSKAMLAAATEALGGKPDVWHVHNHALGKNAALPASLRLLAKEGHRLLLQCHDFAEDGRPSNYAHLLHNLGGGSANDLARQLYPVAAHVHYATLNRRDRDWLAAAGVPTEALHVLANPVELPNADESATTIPQEPLILYPTRAIRRKNLGEFLLWAAIAPRGRRFATTLAPTSPGDMPMYKEWLALASRLKLPYEPEVGGKADLDFVQLLQGASALATTSIAEGFGLAFLEPWLLDRPLIGRDLPEITRDFVDQGVLLDHLYERLDVPVEWIGEPTLQAAVDRELRRIRQRYDMPCSRDDVEAAMDAALRSGRVDFACLDESMQQRVIAHLADGKVSSDELSDLRRLIEQPIGAETIARNRCVVKEKYSLDMYGKRLARLYDNLVASEIGDVDHADGQALLKAALSPERFRLLRT